MTPFSWRKMWPVSRHIWILLAIMAVGVFLRTYNFHDWLQFRDDQSRDAIRVDQVISGESSWPLLGPFLSHSGATEAESFHVGPIYYYFQIVSAKVFGNYPDTLAYPDVFFSILSLPLFFLFMRMYFDRNLSLGLTGLYSISAYLISYSRFAWSSNPIPFFVLLFLYSLLKFIGEKEKRPWLWAILLGIAWGVGFQLHAITMILFSGVVFFVFFFSMRKDPVIWKEWAIVLSIFLLLNGSQIVNESMTDFGNTKAFFGFFSNTDASINPASGGILNKLGNDVSCHIEANFLYLSSYGSSFGLSNCTHDYAKILSGDFSDIHVRNPHSASDAALLLLGLVLSTAGNVLLARNVWKENTERKSYFLRLFALYCGLGFIVMYPLSDGSIADLRYFSFIFFVPYVLFGLLVKSIFESWNRVNAIVFVVILFILIAFFNLTVVGGKSAVLSAQNATCSGATTLGEIEPLVNFISAHSDRESVYVSKDRRLSSALNSVIYLADKRGVTVMRANDSYGNVPEDARTFFMGCAKTTDQKDVLNRWSGESLYIYQTVKQE